MHREGKSKSTLKRNLKTIQSRARASVRASLQCPRLVVAPFTDVPRRIPVKEGRDRPHLDQSRADGEVAIALRPSASGGLCPGGLSSG